MRFDAEVLEYFRRQGRGWQGRMNAVLRSFGRGTVFLTGGIEWMRAALRSSGVHYAKHGKALLAATAMVLAIGTPIGAQEGNLCSRPKFVAVVMKTLNESNEYIRAGLSVVDINNIKEVSNDETNLVCRADFTTSDQVTKSAIFILHLSKTSDTAYIEIEPDR
jgi:hypothetical protein